MVTLLLLATEAASEWPKTDADFALLPPYCEARLRDKPGGALSQEWSKKLGPDFLHIHHYCAGIFSEMAANQTTDPTRRDFLLRDALGEFGYVERNASASLYLMPELLVKKGKILERTKKPVEASEAYRRALQINPKYGLAHKALADLYVSVGKRDEARQVLQEGLSKASGANAKWFEKQIAELDESAKNPEPFPGTKPAAPDKK